MLVCVIDGCQEPIAERAMCAFHLRAWNEGLLEPSGKKRPGKRPGRPRKHYGPCAEPHCSRTAVVRGLCQNHYSQERYRELKRSAKGSPGRKIEDLSGQRIGKITVLRPVNKGANARDLKWVCICDCNSEIEFERRHKKLLARRASGANSNCGKCFDFDPREVIVRQVYAAYSGSAKSRGLEFDLELGDVQRLIFSPCTYCGVLDKEKHGLKYSGIDRVDSSCGYTKTNCLPCCWFCNSAKRAMSQKCWLEWLERICKNFPTSTIAAWS